ncbi:hypothetical protein L0156_25105 [bacterium]|nr:hypothetical protein [bacterium]
MKNQIVHDHLMRRWRFAESFALFLCLFIAANVAANEVSGSVEIILKGEKKESDLSSVVVYLDSLQDFAGDQQLSKPAKIVTRKKQFYPGTITIFKGGRVDFPNFDTIFHNIFSVSTPNQFDLGLYKGGSSKRIALLHQGIVRVFCNVHSHMAATIIVSGTPYYTTADQTGNFRLRDIPPGSYVLKAYAEEGKSEQKIDVGADPLKVHLSIDARNFRKIRHKNKFGKSYGTDENEKY